MSVEQRFLTSAREADENEPGLILEDDGAVWIVYADETRAVLGSGGAGLPPQWGVGAHGELTIAPGIDAIGLNVEGAGIFVAPGVNREGVWIALDAAANQPALFIDKDGALRFQINEEGGLYLDQFGKGLDADERAVEIYGAGGQEFIMQNKGFDLKIGATSDFRVTNHTGLAVFQIDETGATHIEPTSPSVNALTFTGPVGSNASNADALVAVDENGSPTVSLSYSGDSEFAINSGFGYSFRVLAQDSVTSARTGNLFFINPDGDLSYLAVPSDDAAAEIQLIDWSGNKQVRVGNSNKLGFFGKAPATRPATPTDAASIISALQALGLVA